MKTKYKYIEFEPNENQVWTMIDRRTKRGAIGVCVYHGHWRQWVSAHMSCLNDLTSHYHRDIADFLDQLNKEGKP
jgi:hypothetical protein